MSAFNALIMGVVEGITEFLPISSTAHLVLTSRLLGLAQSDFVKSFEIAIQFGAILSVIVLYGKSVFGSWEWIKKIAVAFIPTAIIGFTLYKIIKNVFLSDYSLIVWSLLIGGILLIIFELWHKEKDGSIDRIEDVSIKQCLAIGAFQGLAVIPGVSRSAATILGGLIIGLKRKTIVEFSFILAVPTMLAASSYDLIKSGASFTKDDFGALAIGFAVSFIVAIAAIKFLLSYIRKNSFISFGIYRIILAIIFLLFIL